MTSMNMDIAVGHLADPATLLGQLDTIATQNYNDLLAHRQYDAAALAMHAYLRRTETTRRRIQGPGPNWDDALVAFEESLNHHVLEGVRLRGSSEHLHLGGVNVTRAAASSGLPGGTGTKDTPQGRDLNPAAGETGPSHLPSLAGPASCAPEVPRLRVVRTECGEPSVMLPHMRCAAPKGHPPGLHWMRASNGSDVPSAHGEDQEDQS